MNNDMRFTDALEEVQTIFEQVYETFEAMDYSEDYEEAVDILKRLLIAMGVFLDTVDMLSSIVAPYGDDCLFWGMGALQCMSQVAIIADSGLAECFSADGTKERLHAQAVTIRDALSELSDIAMDAFKYYKNIH